MASVDAFLERTASLRAPIAGASPGGADVTFDPDFEKVKAEMDKLTSMAGSPPNWGEVVETGGRILTEKSKDLRIAVWFAMAKVHRQGWDGFAEGLTVLRSMAADQWDTMFPEAKRGRARANLITWLVDQSTTFFEPRDVVPGDAEAVKAVDELASELDGMLAEKLGDLNPGINKLRGMMRNKVRAIPAEAPPPAPTPEPSAAPAPQAAPAASYSAPAVSAPAGAGSLDDAIPTVRACGKTIADAAKLMRSADPAQPWPYRLLRVGTWVGIQNPPPNEGGRTRIPPPGEDLRKKLAALTEQQKWMDLLAAAEDACATYLFWIDAHRMVAVAMDSLGALFLGSREVVGREVVAFLDKFPTIPQLAFNEGTPFADAGTQSWVDGERKRWGGGSGGGGAASSKASEEDEELNKRFEEARGMVTTGKAGEGLALAVQLANRAVDARTRFRSKLSVAQMALEGGKTEVARPMLEGLMNEVDQHSLESWEPMLCATLYGLLLTCLKAPPAAGKTPSPDLPTRQAFLFDKLCRLDPAAALRLAG